MRDILQLSALAKGRPRVIGGHDHLDRPVRWVHVSDLADLTDLLAGGVLVLTTGLPLAGDARQTETYLDMLVGQDVAGLVIELGTHLKTPPEHLTAVFTRFLPLPVVTLSVRTRFVEVTQQVHRLIVADQYAQVEFARTIHEVFTSLNIARASTVDIVTRAVHTLGAPLVLEDVGRHVQAFCSPDIPTAELLHQWSERSRLHDTSWSAVPVGIGSEQWGRLVLPGPVPDDSRARMVLERAAHSLQLHRMIQQEHDTLMVRALGGLFDDLLSGRISDENEAVARSTAPRLTAGRRYAALSVRVLSSGADALAQGEADRRILAAVRQAVATAGERAIVSIRREGTVSTVLSCPPHGSDRVLAAVSRALRERLTGRAGTDGWVAGTAPTATGLIEAASRLAEAEHLAEVGLTMPEANRLYRSADVRLRGLVALLRDDHRLQRFAETELGPLLDHDARTGDDLLGLLRTHLDCGGSKTHTARLAGLSRPTLYSRLRTVERVLSVSLDSAESRTALHTALMITDARRLDLDPDPRRS
ncbi:PucR family transcriptional regulator [Streptomyces sp. CRN 30]|uniref:PucR family transcriptional regulator n=1 Tax=Streptomyces sp. CRN 30 TaxID=3075613 RepID=UPI002A837275|nr:PucR family transcriptional regulator [Streptomyces sp. CRN 30]